MLGLFPPTDEEKQELEQQAAAANQQPNPQDDLIAAKIEETQASAMDKKTHSILNLAEAHVRATGADATPESPVEQIGKLADAHKDVAEAQQIKVETQHLPQKMAIEGMNARANFLKAHAGRLSAFKNLFNRGGPNG